MLTAGAAETGCAHERVRRQEPFPRSTAWQQPPGASCPGRMGFPCYSQTQPHTSSPRASQRGWVGLMPASASPNPGFSSKRSELPWRCVPLPHGLGSPGATTCPAAACGHLGPGVSDLESDLNTCSALTKCVNLSQCLHLSTPQ